MFDDWESALWTGGFVLAAYGVVLWLAIIVWIYRDISGRTRDGWSQGVAVLLGFLHLPGLFLYLILRPQETLVEAYERRLEAEAVKQELAEARRSCPTCQRSVKEEFLVCPHCRTTLRESCTTCERSLELTWAVCPYCAAPGPGRTAPAVPSVPAEAPPAPAPRPATASASPPPASAPSPDATRRTTRTATTSSRQGRKPAADEPPKAETGTPSSAASPGRSPPPSTQPDASS